MPNAGGYNDQPAQVIDCYLLLLEEKGKKEAEDMKRLQARR